MLFEEVILFLRKLQYGQNLQLLQQDANWHRLPHRSYVIIIVLIGHDLDAASANTACKLPLPSMLQEIKDH